MGVTTWAMVEHEADDALGAAAAVADADERVEQVLIVTPDKDLGQCVRGKRVVQFDRRKREIIDEAGVVAKFGVGAGVDPRLPRARRRLGRRVPGPRRLGRQERGRRARPLRPPRGHPAVGRQWDVPGLRGAEKLAATLREDIELALLFRSIATVETDIDVGTVDDWRVDAARPTTSAPSPTGSARPSWRPSRRPRSAPWPLARCVAPGRDGTRRLRRRPGDLRHTGGAVEGCYLPVLTWFTGARCTGPDRHLTPRGSPGRSGRCADYPSGYPGEHPSRWLR